MARSTPGSSFGPIAISATTAMTTSSLQLRSNILELQGAPMAPLRHTQAVVASAGKPTPEGRSNVAALSLLLALGARLEARLARLMLDGFLRQARLRRLRLGGVVLGHA